MIAVTSSCCQVDLHISGCTFWLVSIPRNRSSSFQIIHRIILFCDKFFFFFYKYFCLVRKCCSIIYYPQLKVNKKKTLSISCFFFFFFFITRTHFQRWIVPLLYVHILDYHCHYYVSFIYLLTYHFHYLS